MLDIKWCYLLVFFIFSGVQCMKVDRYEISMPNVRPNRPELYICTPVKVDPSNPYYIIGFEPNATMHVVHHIILYGCTEPGASLPVWNCGEMFGDSTDNPEFQPYSPCAAGSQIIYAWARDAPRLLLPEGVGFKVGGDTAVQYLVLQVHYAHIEGFRDGHTDASGITLQYTRRPLTKEAGVLLLGTGGKIPALSVENMETSCIMTENKEIHPFAYRTHTHALGKEVQGYVVKKNNDVNKKDEWILLGKRDPMKPQMFYEVDVNTTIHKGDVMAARCVMKNYRSHETYIGSTGKDEMCNFYLMYWVENAPPLETKYCFSEGPPNYYWGLGDNLNNIPDPGYVTNALV
uniref:peptidylglycine monooxygenase n=1 Tax=Cacopsylla melanoneura TaxID=428564 RepID=A0A8D8WKV7_9HEMI